jgi:hypothetical protein
MKHEKLRPCKTKKEPVAGSVLWKKRLPATGSLDTQRLAASGPADTHGSFAVSFSAILSLRYRDISKTTGLISSGK